jgi:hypothetical protein
MKHRVWPVSLFLVLLALAACKQQVRTADAVAYNDAIVDIQTRVVDHFDRFVDAVDTYDSLGAISQLELAIDTAHACSATLEAMPDFDGSAELRDAAKNLVNLYATGLDRDFRPILPLLVSHTSTLQQLEKADSVRTAFSLEEDHLFALLEKAQSEFAKKHQFEVAQP